MDTTADHIIDALGGSTATARLIHTPLSTVHSWRKLGIPASRVAHMKLAAQAEGKAIEWPETDGAIPAGPRQERAA